MLGYYGGYWEAWDSGHKIKFDPINKIININPSVVYIDVKEDIYSAWKEWCLFTDTNNLWQAPAMRAVGGDPITDVKNLGSTFFLINGWKIKPWDNHTNISINGNLYSDDGDRPIIPDNLGNDSVSMYVSNLVDSIIIDNTPIQEDVYSPIWDSSVGITDAYQNADLINIRWGFATDQSNEVRYNVYIGDSENSLFNFKLGTFDNNMVNISTEYDGITNLKNQLYYISVRAIDKYGNETTNTNYAIVQYLSTQSSETDVNVISVNGVGVNSIEDFKTDISSLTTDIQTLIDMEMGNWKIVGTQMIFYRVSGLEIARYDLLDDTGTPSVESVFERNKV